MLMRKSNSGKAGENDDEGQKEKENEEDDQLNANGFQPF